MAKKSDKRRDEMMLATIRINAGMWQDFQALAKRMSSNASALVVGHIEGCLSQHTDGGTNTDAINTDDADGTDTDIIEGSQTTNTDAVSRTYTDVSPQHTDVPIQIDQLRDELLAGIAAKLEGGLLAELLNDAVDFALGDRIKRSDALIGDMRRSLGAFDSKVEDACQRATDTATAFIDSQIEKAIAPINKWAETLESRVEIMDATTCIADTEIYQPEKVVTAFEPEEIEAALPEIIAPAPLVDHLVDQPVDHTLAVEEPALVVELEEIAPALPEPEKPNGLTQKELAARLKFAPSRICQLTKPDSEKALSETAFADWTREHDPDGIAWRRENGRYWRITD